MKVFCYGTLMRGYGNYKRLLEGKSEYLGTTFTTPHFTMLHLGGFPGVIGGGHTAIKGEVFEVNEQTKRNLDRLEGHPNFYKRTPITLADGSEVEIYILQESGRNLEGYDVVESGDWRTQDPR